MCKHVAAVLYGVGARLDREPDLLFALRHVDASDLIAQASTTKPKTGDAATAKVLDDSALADVFGIEMVDSAPPPPLKSIKKPTAKTAKTVAAPKTTKAAPTARKPAKKTVFSVEMFFAAPKAPAKPIKKPASTAKPKAKPGSKQKPGQGKSGE